MSKSVGQIVGSVVGAAVGFAFPAVGFALGSSIGGVIGGLIDPPKGPHTVGPRLDDLSFQSNTYGAPLPRFYGTVPVLGNIFWLEGDKYQEVSHTETSGGKGGSKATAETFKYYATFAVGFGLVLKAGQTAKLRRMWIGSNLVYDASGTSLDSTIASHNGAVNFTWYDGSDPQAPNPRMQADKGAANVSGYPGLCYAVIEDLDLDPYSRTLAMAQVKVEVSIVSASAALSVLGETGADIDHKLASIVFEKSSATYFLADLSHIDGALRGFNAYKYTYGVGREFLYRNEIFLHAGYLVAGPSIVYASQADVPAALVIVGTYGAPKRTYFYRFDGVDHLESEGFDEAVVDYGVLSISSIAAGFFFAGNQTGTSPIYRFDGVSLSAVTAASVRAYSLGHSESYLWALVVEATPTINRYDINTLALIDTWSTGALSGATMMSVESDSVCYVSNITTVAKFVNGTAEVINATVGNAAFPSAFRVIDGDPSSTTIISTKLNTGDGTVALRSSYNTAPAASVKLRDIVTAECALVGIDAAELELSSLTNSDVRGMRIASGSPRPALEQVQAIFPFDVTISGYKLKFVSRGGSSVATIPESDLGAHASGGEVPELLTIAREMDSQIPATVRIKYLNPEREYDLGEQFSTRPCTASVGERTVETAVVLNDTEAARAADVLNQKDWVERREFGPFSLPPTYSHLEAADVVTVAHRGVSHELRLTRIEYLADGRLDCAGVLTSAQSYTSTATGVASLVAGQSVVPLRGETSALLLDIPRIRSEQDVFGMCYGLLGKASGWPGGVLLRSDDSGNSYQGIGSSNTLPRAFVASNTLAAHHCCSADFSSVLTVTPQIAAHLLYSVTEEQWYSQSNLAAYGADGRWEIVSFRTVVDNTGTFTLRDFLRGLYGTEWAAGLHAAGDFFILLDTASIGFFGLPTNAVGSTRQYRAVTKGAVVDSAPVVIDTYDAFNLKPLSPVDICGHRDLATHDWEIVFARRTRHPVELFSGADVPLGESSEAYEVEIYNADYSVLKRTIGGLVSASAAYTSAQQIADHGSKQETIFLDVYQRSASIGRGNRGRFSITRPLAVDEFAAQVVLLMHMDGANNSTVFTDEKGHSATANGAAKITTARSLAGGSSAVFDGTSGCYVSLAASSDWDVGSGDFTLEFFVYVNAYNANNSRLFQSANGDVVTGLYVVLTSSGRLSIASSSNGSSFNLFSATVGTIATGGWKHVAYVRNGTSWDAFIEGVKYNLATAAGTVYFNAAATPVIGGQSGVNRCLDGNVEDLRLTKSARYTADFTPPAAPFPNP